MTSDSRLPFAVPPAIPPSTTSANPKVMQLAELFEREPELILACLESGSGDGSAVSSVVLSAAELAVARRPHYADLRYFAAHAAARGGKPGRAQDLLEQALDLNPGYRDAQILAARVALADGRFDQALAYVRQAVTDGADYPDVHLMLGDLCRQRGELLEARRAYERALSLNANLDAARLGLAALGSSGQLGGSDELPA